MRWSVWCGAAGGEFDGGLDHSFATEDVCCGGHLDDLAGWCGEVGKAVAEVVLWFARGLGLRPDEGAGPFGSEVQVQFPHQHFPHEASADAAGAFAEDQLVALVECFQVEHSVRVSDSRQRGGGEVRGLRVQPWVIFRIQEDAADRSAGLDRDEVLQVGGDGERVQVPVTDDAVDLQLDAVDELLDGPGTVTGVAGAGCG